MTISKLTFTNVNRARDCVHWVIKNIGPVIENPGTSVRGEGWHLWTTIPDFTYAPLPTDVPTYTIELNEHVDEETQLFFMLKWAE
jgi:hypothetical protein